MQSTSTFSIFILKHVDNSLTIKLITMSTPLSQSLILNMLVKHETLTINDLAKEENLGIVPEENHLHFMLHELTNNGHLTILDGVTPSTYTITGKGIEECNRINELQLV